MSETQCKRCKQVFTPLDDMRFRAGSFYDPVREKTYDQICEDCHRDLRG